MTYCIYAMSYNQAALPPRSDSNLNVAIAFVIYRTQDWLRPEIFANRNLKNSRLAPIKTHVGRGIFSCACVADGTIRAMCH